MMDVGSFSEWWQVCVELVARDYVLLVGLWAGAVWNGPEPKTAEDANGVGG